MAKLVVLQGDNTGREFILKDVTTIGRQEGNDVMLAGEAVSRYHCKIELIDNQHHLIDTNSANGVAVNGATVKKAVLDDRDEIQVGDWRLLYHAESKADDDGIIGKTIGGYQILKKLGAGGMGHVYQARQVSLDRIVALKILNKRLSMDKTYIKSFFQEARLAARLNHPNIVQIYDVGDVDFTLFYFSMEFVDGPNLHDILDRDGYIPIPEALHIAHQIADAMICARDQKVVHQDIKPRNVMLTKNGIAKLADLGLAKVFGTHISDGHKGRILGTPYYMSPEQAQGLEVDFRSDMYSLGATLYHLITGTPPYDGKTVLAIVAQHLSAPLPDPRENGVIIPAPVMNLIGRMMAKKPEDRFGSFEEVIGEIDTIFERGGNDLYARRIRSDGGFPAVGPANPDDDSVPMAEPLHVEPARPVPEVRPITFEEDHAGLVPVALPVEDKPQKNKKPKPRAVPSSPDVMKKSDARRKARLEGAKRQQYKKTYISLAIWGGLFLLAFFFLYTPIKRMLATGGAFSDTPQKQQPKESGPKDVFTPAPRINPVTLDMLNASVPSRFIVENGELAFDPERKGIVFPMPEGNILEAQLKCDEFFIGDSQLDVEVRFLSGAPFFEAIYFKDKANFVRVTFNRQNILIKIRFRDEDIDAAPQSSIIVEDETYNFSLQIKNNRLTVKVNGHERASRFYEGLSKLNAQLKIVALEGSFLLTKLRLEDQR